MCHPATAPISSPCTALEDTGGGTIFTGGGLKGLQPAGAWAGHRHVFPTQHLPRDFPAGLIHQGNGFLHLDAQLNCQGAAVCWVGLNQAQGQRGELSVPRAFVRRAELAKQGSI